VVGVVTVLWAGSGMGGEGGWCSDCAVGCGLDGRGIVVGVVTVLWAGWAGNSGWCSDCAVGCELDGRGGWLV
jgi:hypothetical protein